MNLLVTGGWYESSRHLDEIRNLGYNLYYLEKESDALPCDPGIIDGIVCCKVFNWHPIEQFKRLRFIQTESVGYDRVPMDYCREHGIAVHNVKDTYARPMSEYVIGHILSWYQNMQQELDNQAAGGWVKFRGKRELTGKNVCIIGTGNIARFTAKKLAAFDCKVTGITHTVREIDFFDEVVGYSEMKDVLPEADILIMAAPPTGSPVVGKAELALMKDTSIIVNVSRGTELDQAALAQMLKNRQIQAAILDVFETEPLEYESELWGLDNILITPHSSYIGEGNAERLWQVIRNTLEQYIAKGAVTIGGQVRLT